MKMVKSLLLGSAAGLVAVAGAHAADLPVKAKAVEYVKVCSAYGAGYYYIPGTDTCIKIGGYVRFDTYINATGTFNPFISNQSGGIVRDDRRDSYRSRVRGLATIDARTQTEYGTLRSYVGMGMNLDSWRNANGGTDIELDRAFIQFAGLTAGYTTSIFDPQLNYMLTTPYTMTKRKMNLLAYTAQFGNGFSASLSVEDQRFIDVYNDDAYNLPAAQRAGSQAPDIVGTLRVEQAWGSAQISGAAHQSRYTNAFDYFNSSSDVWGWAIGGTLEFDLGSFSQGDSFFVTAAYGDGALNYVGLNGSDRATANATQFGGVKTTGFGGTAITNGAFYQLSDIVFNGVDGYDKTSAWSITGQYRHFWTPGLRSAVMVGYVDVDAPETQFAYDNGFLDFKLWQVGFNTIWSPVKNLDIAAEVLYSKVEGKHDYNDGQFGAGVPGLSAPVGFGGSTDLWSGGVRIQRNF